MAQGTIANQLRLRCMWLLLGTLCATLPLGCGGCGAVSSTKNDEKDEDKIQGTWIIIEAEHDGESVDKAVMLEFVVKGDILTMPAKVEGGEQAKLKLDSSQTPKTMDLMSIEDNSHRMLGIYEFRGDTLRMCLDRDGKKRPKEFATNAHRQFLMYTLGKEKKQDKAQIVGTWRMESKKSGKAVELVFHPDKKGESVYLEKGQETARVPVEYSFLEDGVLKVENKAPLAGEKEIEKPTRFEFKFVADRLLIRQQNSRFTLSLKRIKQ